MNNLREVERFEWFAMGWLHKSLVEEEGNTVYQYADLRYGLVPDPKDSLFSLNVIDTNNGFELNTQNPISDSGEISTRIGNLFQSAYPSSCEQLSVGSR